MNIVMAFSSPHPQPLPGGHFISRYFGIANEKYHKNFVSDTEKTRMKKVKASKVIPAE
jgi:hypothetical protein